MKKVIPSIILAGAMSTGSLLAIDVYEGYDYSTGDLNVANGSGGTGWNGGWYGNSGLTFAGQSGSDIVSKTWSTPTNYGFTPTGNAGQNDQASSNVAFRELGASNTIDFGADGTYYFSFLLNKGNSNNAAFNFGIGNGDVVIGGDPNTVDAGNSSALPWAGMQLGAGGSGNGIQVGSQNGSKNYTFVTGLPLNQDILIVGRLNTFAGASNDTLSFNIYTAGDTVSLTDPGSFSYALGNSAQTGVADRITIGASNTGNDFSGNLATNVIFDEFRMGDTWQSVVVPEPSAYSLIAGALALSWIMVRRKK